MLLVWITGVEEVMNKKYENHCQLMLFRQMKEKLQKSKGVSG